MICNETSSSISEIQIRLDAIEEYRHIASMSVAELMANLKDLTKLCVYSKKNQLIIAKSDMLNNYLNSLLFTCGSHPVELQTIGYKLLANCIVDNIQSQDIMWGRHGKNLVAQCHTAPLGKNTDIKLMILYNMFLNKVNLLSDQQMLNATIRVWQTIMIEKCNYSFEYLHIIFENFLTKNEQRTLNSYNEMDASYRCGFLDYITSYINQGSPNGNVHHTIIKYLSKEFKQLSDTMLRNTTQLDDNVEPREVYSLLRVIASGSGCESYAPHYINDHGLFLNVSSLLRFLVAAGKEPIRNAFTPMAKLEEVAPNSDVNHDFENEISYEFKTLLMRSIANLLYKNPSNQTYCLETKLIPTVLECTSMDARNPLLKEWSIIAIRNACNGNMEIQQLLAGLTLKGPANNDIMTELNLDMGSLRIRPNNN